MPLSDLQTGPILPDIHAAAERIKQQRLQGDLAQDRQALAEEELGLRRYLGQQRQSLDRDRFNRQLQNDLMVRQDRVAALQARPDRAALPPRQATPPPPPVAQEVAPTGSTQADLEKRYQDYFLSMVKADLKPLPLPEWLQQTTIQSTPDAGQPAPVAGTSPEVDYVMRKYGLSAAGALKILRKAQEKGWSVQHAHDYFQQKAESREWRAGVLEEEQAAPVPSAEAAAPATAQRSPLMDAIVPDKPVLEKERSRLNRFLNQSFRFQ